MDSTTQDHKTGFPEIPGYQIIEEIGRGGMAVVYKAVQVSLGRHVALKVLYPSLSADPELVKRFQREAKAAAVMKHPNIVDTYNVGEANGYYFIAMEYVEGRSLKEYLSEKGSLPPDESIRILKDVASALDYAHQQGFVHRDVKPSNVLIDEETDRALLTDFGVVKALHEGTHLTHTGTFIGTLKYASPEQIQGKSVGIRSDLYSLGVMAYEMLCGRPPFEGAPAALMLAHIHKPPPPLSGVPAEVNEIFLRALAKSPDDRYESASEFVDDLKGAFQGQEVGVIQKVEEETPGGTENEFETRIDRGETIVKEPSRRRTQSSHKTTNRKENKVPWVLAIPGALIILAIGAFLLSAHSRSSPAKATYREQGATGVVEREATPTFTLTPSPTATFTPTPDWSAFRSDIEYVIRHYGDIKARAFRYLDPSPLDEVLVGKALEQKRRSICWLRNNNMFYTFSGRHVRIIDIRFRSPDSAVAVAYITEHRVLYKNDEVHKDYGLDEYWAIYTLVRKSDDRWYISCMKAVEHEEDITYECDIEFKGENPCTQSGR